MGENVEDTINRVRVVEIYNCSVEVVLIVDRCCFNEVGLDAHLLLDFKIQDLVDHEHDVLLAQSLYT